jgi:hypothetical protein
MDRGPGLQGGQTLKTVLRFFRAYPQTAQHIGTLAADSRVLVHNENPLVFHIGIISNSYANASALE